MKLVSKTLTLAVVDGGPRNDGTELVTESGEELLSGGETRRKGIIVDRDRLQRAAELLAQANEQLLRADNGRRGETLPAMSELRKAAALMEQSYEEWRKISDDQALNSSERRRATVASEDQLQDTNERHRLATIASEEQLHDTNERHRRATVASEEQLHDTNERHRRATVASEEQLQSSNERHRLATVASEEQLQDSNERHRLATVASDEQLQDSNERHRLATAASDEQLQDSNERHRIARVASDEQHQASNERHRLAAVASEERLQDSDERCRVATQAAEMGTWFWDVRTGDVILDAKSKSLFGRPTDMAPVTFETFLSLLHPEDQQPTESSLNHALNEGGLYDLEYRIVWPDESVHWIAAKGRADRSSTGSPFRMQGVVVDITARRAATEALREGQARLSAYLQSASQGVVAFDNKGRIELANRSAEEMFGYKHDELLGQRLEVLLPERYRAAYEQHQTRYFAKPDGRPISAGENLNGLTKDGTEFPIEVGLSFVASNQGGTAICFVTNISERRRAEESLRRTLGDLQTLIETCPLTILTMDTDGQVTSWNASAERTLGFTREEVLHRLPPFVPDKSRDDFLEIVNAIRLDKQIVHCLSTLRRKNGSPVDVEIWAAPLHQTGGNVRQGVIVMTDLTDRKAMEQQLIQAQKMEAVGRLAGGIAHDFNNLLTAISGYNEMLIQKLENRPQLLSYAKGVQNAAQRASGLTNQMLAFSRGQVTQRQVLDLNEIVFHIHQMLRRIIGEEIRLSIKLAVEPTYVSADPTQIDQIILNLAVNARDAMPDGGAITIETTNVTLDASGDNLHMNLPRGPYVMLAVSDTGIGMDSETKKHLFEPFFTTKEKDKGTGLGLSIVYGIVEQHAGGMQVLSELTQGATFKVYLPAALAEDPREQLPFVTAVPGHNTGRVLLVEDEDIVRNLVSEVLRDQGFLVLEAATPLMAIQVAKDFGSSIDLLLTDVIMPGMRGPELAALVTRQHPETKVVFMSGYPHSASEDVPQAEIAYLQKPFTATELISTLRNALSGNPQ